MKLIRVLGMGVLAAAAFGLGCDESKNITQPPPPPSIAHGIYYTKTVDDATGLQNGLQDNDVYDIMVRPDNTVWIGNQGGLAIYPNLDTTVRSGAFDETDGLTNPKVRRIVEHNGIVYVATWGGGVSVYDVAGDTWSALRAKSLGLADDQVSDIVVDGNLIYFATNLGVSEYDPAMDTWRNYRRGGTGGLLDNLVSTMEFADTPRGKEFWFGPRVEFGLQVGEEAFHGITVTRETFNAAPVTLVYSAVKDNTIYQDPLGTTSNGAGRSLWSGVQRQALWPGAVADSLRRTALIAFDITGIPLTATITSARLTMRVTGGDPLVGTVVLRRALSNWGEGTSQAADSNSVGAPATAGDATWAHTFYPGSFWGRLGGDLLTTSSATRAVGDTSTVFWTSATMAADVQRWLRDPSTNFGWAIYSGPTVVSGNNDIMKRFASRESSRPEWRPRLEVVYKHFQYLTTVTSDLAEPNVNDIMYDTAQDVYYVCFGSKGIGVADYTSSSWTYYTMADGLPSDQVFSIVDLGGVLWVATQDGIARQLIDGSWRGYDRNAGLKTDRVRRVYTDDQTRLWLSYVETGAGRVLPATAE